MPTQDDHADQLTPSEDPVYRNSLREAKIILSLWVACLIYTCAYCYLFGYDSHPADPAATGPAVSSWFGALESFNRHTDSLTTPLGLGIPDWVFYGVVLPWIVCIVATFWFCLFVFREDDLGSGEELALAPSQAVGDGGPSHG